MQTADRVGTRPDSWLRQASTRTPLRRVTARTGGRSSSGWLKLEMANPTGSVKFRTALSLLGTLDRAEPLVPGGTIVESTSGNLGLALAHLSSELGFRYVAVVDPKLPSATRHAMEAAGAEIVTVTVPDEQGGYLLARLRTVGELCAGSPTARWANQYGSPANPLVHREVTGPELVDQTGGRLDLVAVAVSTGGTLAGIGDCVRRAVPAARILAVDVAGSLATSGSAGEPYLLTGIGATRRSFFLRPRHYDRIVHVRDIDAIAACRMLEQDTGLALGGSAGAVLAACLPELAGRSGPPPRLPVMLCPDGGAKYADTLYDDLWLDLRGSLGAVRAAMAEARGRGLRFDLDPAVDHVAD